MLLLLTSQAGAAVHYVNVANSEPSPPYTSWATAAQIIQDAIDIALPGDHILVTNAIYSTGGRAVNGSAVTNRVAITGAFTVESVNGPAVTVIQGWQVPGTTNGDSAVRCVSLTNGAVLIGFTLTNGATRASMSELDGTGGGLRCQFEYYGPMFVSNCIITGNSAYLLGGGAYRGMLNNCVLSGNSADIGGGCSDSTLINCTVGGNSARFYGGAYNSILTNCIVYFNGSGNSADSDLHYCCTTPIPLDGSGRFNNITNAPLFVDLGGGNLRLQSNSPCINSGFNIYAAGTIDLDGLPRISGGTVDIGAYEFQNPPTLISIAWLLLYGLPIDGSADNSDPDSDGLNNWQEWRAGTDPTNALSALRLRPPSQVGNDLVVSWESVAGRSYSVERSTDLGALPCFELLASRVERKARDERPEGQ